MGKNIFTNALPLALANYLHFERQLPLSQIAAVTRADGSICTEHNLRSWLDIVEVPSGMLRFDFETVFSGYGPFTHSQANKSDVVISEIGGEHKRALEIKLVVTPTSGTARKPRNEQSCEIVVRPPSIEQLAFSIAHSFGTDRIAQLANLLIGALNHPHDFQWSDTNYMLPKVDSFVNAAESIIRAGIEVQTPLFLIAVWRTKGQSPQLDENAFDVFVATDLAFLTLFTEAAKRSKRPRENISRPERSLIWLIYALWQYATQGSLNFGNIHERLTYGSQTDKAGSFTSNASLSLMESDVFFYPRISREEITEVVTTEGLALLMPERRLDQALWIQSLINDNS